MIKRKVQILANERGETLAETLVSILIASLSTVMLATAIAAATSIVMKTRATTASYFESVDDLVSGEGSSSTVAVTEKGLFGEGSSSSWTISVNRREHSLPGGETGIAYEAGE